jgi:hypothetical protein
MFDKETNQQYLKNRKKKIDIFVEKMRVLEMEVAENPDDSEALKNLEGCHRLYETLMQGYTRHFNYVTENDLFESDALETIIRMAKGSG